MTGCFAVFNSTFRVAGLSSRQKRSLSSRACREIQANFHSEEKMERENLKAVLETLIFVSKSPVTVHELHQILQEGLSLQVEPDQQGDKNFPQQPETDQSAESQLDQKIQSLQDQITKTDVRQILCEIQEKYQQDVSHGFELVEVAGAFQFRSKAHLAGWVHLLFKPSPTKLSKAAMEVLSIIAYKQPLTRVEVDQVRGVDSAAVIKNLLEKNLLRIVGRKEEPGKPALYGTSPEFLELFGLKSIKELPSLRDLEAIEAEFREQASSQDLILSTDDEDSTEEFELRTSEMDDEEKDEFMELEAKLKDLKTMEAEIFKKPEASESSEVSDTTETTETQEVKASA